MEEGEFSGRLESVACNLCGGGDYYVLFRSTLGEKDFEASQGNYLISEKSGHCGRIVKCKNCGFVYVSPRERYKDIIQDYSLVKDEAYLGEKKMRQAAFLRELGKIEKLLPQKGRLLDVGCFAGLFLDLARSQGWSVRGVEPSQWAAAYAKEKLGLDVVQTAIEDLRLGDEAFDVVTLWDVIEHLIDPKARLASLSKALKKEGLLFLTTPDYNSIIRRIFGRKCWFIVRAHIYYFTPHTIRRLLEDCGFEVLSIDRHLKTLSLEYFAGRFREVSAFLGNILTALSKKPLLKNATISLYAGQISVLARKKPE